MKILAFLQNQWYPPDKIKYIRYAYAKHATTPEDRADLNARYLFFRCLSGKRLRTAFGEDLCDIIDWENSSPEIGDNPSAVFPPNLDHMRCCIEAHKPDLVIAFGKIAAEAVPKVWTGPMVITCHPAARQNAPALLADAAKRVRGIMASAVPQAKE